MDGSMVLTVGLKGSLVELVNTGGNSPLAEKETQISEKGYAFCLRHVQQWNPVAVNIEELSVRCGANSRGNSFIWLNRRTALHPARHI